MGRGASAANGPATTPMPLTASEYLSMHVYPTLEPGLEELLKLAFPPEDFGRPPPQARTPTRTPDAAPPAAEADSEAPAEGGEPAETAADGADGADGGDGEADEAGDASQPPPAAKAVLPPATPWFNAGSRSCEPFETDRAGGTFPGGKPLVWLAQYLKARTNKAKLEGQEQAYAAALGLAAREETELEAHLTNLCVAVRQLLWPCSVTVSKRRTIKRALPPPTPPPKPEGGGEGEEGEEEPTPEEEGEEQKQPPKVEYEDVAALGYIATSHPTGILAIEGRILEYEERGVTGRAVATGETLLVPDVAEDEALHWFVTPPTPPTGSYCALPILDQGGQVWGVLGIDTLLDGRQLTWDEVGKVQELVAAGQGVFLSILSTLPPTPTEEAGQLSQDEGEGGPGETGEAEGEEGP